MANVTAGQHTRQMGAVEYKGWKHSAILVEDVDDVDTLDFPGISLRQVAWSPDVSTELATVVVNGPTQVHFEQTGANASGILHLWYERS